MLIITEFTGNTAADNREDSVEEVSTAAIRRPRVDTEDSRNEEDPGRSLIKYDDDDIFGS